MKKKKSKRWNFGEISDFKYLKFFQKKKHTYAELFDKIAYPYNKTTQKF